MKKSIITIILVSLVLSIFSSCISTNKGFQSSPVISRYVHLDPIKADIEVEDGKKLNGESSATYFLIFRVQGDNTYADGIVYSTDANANALTQYNPMNMINQMRLNKVRGAAAFKALEGGDFDVLVHPTYTVTTENFWIVKKYTVKVQGYGAKYTNFRTEKQKVIILNNGQEISIPDNE